MQQLQTKEANLDPEKVDYDGPVPDSMQAALRLLVNKPFLATPRHKAQHWRADRTGADERILAFERAFIRRFNRLGVPMFAHCVLRPNAVQTRLYVQGHTKAKAGQSPHNHGFAVDLVHGLRAWEVPKPCWDLIGHIGKEVAKSLNVKVEWGGDWRFYDPAHWEIQDWESQTRTKVAGSHLDQSLKLYGIA